MKLLEVLFDYKYSEPNYFNFKYQEIKTQTKIELLNTIYFESVLRIFEEEIELILKDINNKTLTEEDIKNMLENFINEDNEMKSPLYETKIEIQKKVKQTFEIIHNMGEKEDLIELFFQNNNFNSKNDIKQNYLQTYKILFQMLQNLEKLSIPEKIYIPVKKNSKKNYINIANIKTKLIQYGIDLEELIAYVKNITPFLEKAKKYQENFEFEKISSCVKNYIKTIHLNFHTNSDFFIILNRPVIKFLPKIHFTLPIDDKNKEALKDFMNSLKEKDYSSILKKSIPLRDYINFSNEKFSQILFVYDYLKFCKKSKEKKVKIIQRLIDEYSFTNEKQPNKSLSSKTLLNQLKQYENFLEELKLKIKN